MLKTVYSALAVTALLAGTASFAADQTPAAATPAAPVAATASSTAAVAPAPAVTPAKEAVKATHTVAKAAKKDGAVATETSATSTPKKK